MARLDSALWSPDALGMLGLPGAITEARRPSSRLTYYVPFYDWMRSPAALPAHLRARCQVLVGNEEIARVLQARIAGRSGDVLRLALESPVHAVACVLRSGAGHRELQSAAVVAHPLYGPEVVIAVYYWVSPTISMSTRPEDVFAQATMVGVLGERLVSDGFVAVIVPVPDARVRRVYAPLLAATATLRQVVQGAEAKA